jgi:hypothetical protein
MVSVHDHLFFHTVSCLLVFLVIFFTDNQICCVR